MPAVAPPRFRQQLVDALVAGGVPTAAEAEEMTRQREPGATWVTSALNSNKVDETRFLARLAEGYRVAFEPRLDPASVEREALKALPSRFVFQHQVLPLSLAGTTLTLATYDLFNTASRQLAAQLAPAGMTLRWMLVPRGPLLRAIKTLYGVGAETFDEILSSSTSVGLPDDREAIATDLNADDPEASVVRFVNLVFREALGERATDIHVEPLENDLRIRYRIDGMLHETAVPPQLRLLQNAIISRLKVMSQMDIAEKRLPQDGRISLKDGARDIDVRVSTIPTVHGESISLRLLNRDEERFNLERLDLGEHHLELTRELLKQPNGIILITGPTGSGKSTTLYCFLSSINSVQRRIITIEDPVEYRLAGVSQIEVRPEIQLTFATGLRHILRQDPNVVMVGEMRDFETAEIGIRAAMTGHLVFSTLHTNDAVGAITRLLDMGVEPFLVSSVVRAFIAQRLVRTICPHCVEDHEYDPAYLASIGFPAHYGHKFKRGAGCEHCRHSGYLGRKAIYELCAIGKALQDEIARKADGSVLKTVAQAQGMVTLRQDGWRRVHQGFTTVEEVIRVTQEDEALAETD